MADYFTDFSFEIPVNATEIEKQTFINNWVDQAEDNEDYYGALGLKATNTGIWVSSDGLVDDLEQALDFAVHALSHYGITVGIIVSWANTCSKPRLGSFGGGAALVTSDGILDVCNPESELRRLASENEINLI